MAEYKGETAMAGPVITPDPPTKITNQSIIGNLAPQWADMACVVVYWKAGPKSGQREIFIANTGVEHNPKATPPTPLPADTSAVEIDDTSTPGDPCVYYQAGGGWESVCW